MTSNMPAFSVILGEKQVCFMTPGPPVEEVNHAEEIALLRKELQLLKNANPFRTAELALELQIERIRVAEITKARDVALERLSDAYVSIRQKNEFIETLQRERESNGLKPLAMQLLCHKDSAETDKLKAHILTLEATIQDLRLVIRELPQSPEAKPTDPPPCYEENMQRNRSVDIEVQTEQIAASAPTTTILGNRATITQDEPFVPPQTDDPKELAEARNAVLSAIPLPPNPPDATLSAIVIPPPFTLHEFLNGAPPPLKNSLSSYRILQNVTTSWCPEREEHGYMYTPVFKCSTNPRIATAHRWSAVDVLGRMIKPTECFYHKDGVWYYAGSYKAFKLDTLSAKEWAQLTPETVSAIVKETISGRKNSSPQNTYETSQLYAAGALKVACVGLQCVGFNQDLYKAIIEHSIKFGEMKWKVLATPTPGVPGGGSASGAPAASGDILPGAPSAPATKTSSMAPRHIAAGHRAPSHVTPVGAVGNVASFSGTPSQPGVTTISGNGTPLSSVSSIWAVPANRVILPRTDLAGATNVLSALQGSEGLNGTADC